MKVFPFLLADDAKEWWISEGDGKITTWEELVEKFFCRFYPESYDEKDEMLDEGENWGIDPLKFLSNVNTSISSYNERKESKYENPSNTTTDSFFKAYDVRDIEKENGRKQTKRKDNDKDNKKPNKRRCKAEKFEAIQYSIGPNKEYIAIRKKGQRLESDASPRNERNLKKIYLKDFVENKSASQETTPNVI
ncbi:hypothetical protein Tco_1493903 [Tanacetum coccineum]